MEQSLPLRDIHLPEAINWWPPAIGWWLLIILIPVLIFGAWRLYKELTRRTATKQARTLLAAIKHDQHATDLQKLQQISIWLRRVSISQSPRHISAGLTGKAWLNYLDSSVDGLPFSEGIGQCLVDVHYRPVAPKDINIPAVITLCELWLQGQKK